MKVVPVYALHNVSKSYSTNHIISNLNLNILHGQMVAIVGKSGSGKSTLLNMLGMLEKPDEGSIKFYDEDILKIGRKRRTHVLRNQISYLFQNYALIENDRVDGNLEVALAYSRKSKKEKQDLKMEALRKVGLNIPLNKKVYELSGGEQQRVALARILLKPCDVILADEPTGSLDAINRDFVVNMLTALNRQGKTIVVVTHDDIVAEHCEQIIEL
ncbi:MULTISPECIES: ABC transporter ATP-binding protein [Paenibacillus]|uniref:ABC transporter ATP-binding protein n=1 Tax=Paenibacillus TaxID=44249 RepID=UPI0025A01127|nr:ABC transporter ATP-binding protein [Paenibacillus sp. PK1-4R]WJM08303.1 ABC transporter ATP-binding protein [Paenibacillus sp. PK1-4R]